MVFHIQLNIHTNIYKIMCLRQCKIKLSQMMVKLLTEKYTNYDLLNKQILFFSSGCDKAEPEDHRH